MIPPLTAMVAPSVALNNPLFTKLRSQHSLLDFGQFKSAQIHNEALRIALLISIVTPTTHVQILTYSCKTHILARRVHIHIECA